MCPPYPRGVARTLPQMSHANSRFRLSRRRVAAASRSSFDAWYFSAGLGRTFRAGFIPRQPLSGWVLMWPKRALGDLKVFPHSLHVGGTMAEKERSLPFLTVASLSRKSQRFCEDLSKYFAPQPLPPITWLASALFASPFLVLCRTSKTSAHSSPITRSPSSHPLTLISPLPASLALYQLRPPLCAASLARLYGTEFTRSHVPEFDATSKHTFRSSKETVTRSHGPISSTRTDDPSLELTLWWKKTKTKKELCVHQQW